jgi:hypothetical protein
MAEKSAAKKTPGPAKKTTAAKASRPMSEPR